MKLDDDLAPLDPAVEDALLAARRTLAEVPPSTPSPELSAFLDGAPAATRKAVERNSGLVAPDRRSLVAVAAVLALLVAGVTALVLGSGEPSTVVAAGGSGGTTSTLAPSTTASTSTTATSTTSTTATTAPPLDAAPVQVPVRDAGSLEVAVVDGTPVLTRTFAEDGWLIVEESPDDPGELDLSFRRGDDRVDVDIDIEDGELQIRIRDRRLEGEDRSTSNRGSSDDDHDDDRDDDDSDDDDDDDDDDDRDDDDSDDDDDDDRDDDDDDSDDDDD